MTIQQLTRLESGGISERLPAPQVQRDTGSANPAPESAPQPSPNTKQVQQAVEQIQRAVSVVAQNLQFSVDQGTGKTVIRVVDTQTKEVVRQIPTEEIISIARALDRMQGLLLNGKA